jgi:enoyl-CoA hydratase/carnithine racemase
MTLAMYIRLAGDQARFGSAFERRGIVIDAASPWFLPCLAGTGKAAVPAVPTGWARPSRRCSWLGSTPSNYFLFEKPASTGTMIPVT